MLQFAEDYDESTSATKLLLIPDHIREANKPQIDMIDRLNITFKTATYGTLNNFIELGKWSGLASEDSTTYDIKQMLSDERYDLGVEYSQNQNLYDMFGSLVASFAPGSAALWGIRAMKAASFAGGGTSRLASMMVAPYTRAEAARKVYMAEAEKIGSETGKQALTTYTKAKHDMWKWTTAQQAYEGAVVGTAIEFSLNAGHTLNNDALTASQALGHLGAGIAFGAIAQGAIGGVWVSRGLTAEGNALRTGTINAEELPYLQTPVVGNAQGGTKAAMYLGAYDAISKVKPTTPLMEAAQNSAKLKAETQLTEQLRDMYSPELVQKFGEKGIANDTLYSTMMRMTKDDKGREELAARLQGGAQFRMPNSRDFQRVAGVAAAGDAATVGGATTTLGKLQAVARPATSTPKGVVDAAEYDRLVARLSSGAEPKDLDITDLRSILDFRAHGGLQQSVGKAKLSTPTQLADESNALFVDHGIPMHKLADDTYEDYANWQQVYKLRSEMGSKEFKAAYPTYARVLKDMGAQDATHLFGRKRTLFTNLKTGAITGEIGRHLGDNPLVQVNASTNTVMLKGAAEVTTYTKGINGMPKAADARRITGVSDSSQASTDLLEYQAQRVLASSRSRKDGAELAATVGSKDWSNINALENALVGAVGKDGIAATIKLGKTDYDVQPLIEKLAAFKIGEYERLAAANPSASADEIASAIGVSEKFVVSRGQVGKFTDATGNSWEVGLKDVAESADELLKPRHYALDYDAPSYFSKHSPEIWAYQTGEAAKARAGRQAVVAATMLNEEQRALLPDAIPVEAVMGYNRERFTTNTAQIGGYQSLQQWAAGIGDHVMRWASDESIAIRQKLVGVSDVMLRDTKSKGEVAAATEWYSRAKGELMWASDDTVIASAYKKDWLAAKDAGVSAKDFAKQLGQDEAWVFQEPLAAGYLREMGKAVYSSITKPKMALHQEMGKSLDVAEDVFYLPPRDYAFATYLIRRNKNPLAESEEEVLRVVGATEEELGTALANARAKEAAGGYSFTEVTRNDVNAYKQAQKRWEFSDDKLRGSGARSGLNRSGQAGSFMPEADAHRLVDEHNRWINRQVEMKYGNAIELNYADEFAMLQRMADDASNKMEGRALGAMAKARVIMGKGVATQKYVSDYETLMATMKGGDAANPSVWKDINNSVDAFGAKVWEGVARTFRGGKVQEVGRKAKGKLFGQEVLDEGDRAMGFAATADAMLARLKDAGIEANAGEYVAARIVRETGASPADVRGLVSAANRVQSMLMFRLDAADAAMNVLGAMTKGAGELSYLMSRRPKLGPEQQAIFDSEMYALFGTRAGSIGADGTQSLPKIHIGKALVEGIKGLFIAEGKAEIDDFVAKGLMLKPHQLMRDAFEEMRLDTSGTVKQGLEGWRKQLEEGGSKLFGVLSTPSDFSNMAVQYSALKIADRLGRAAGMQGAELNQFMWTFNRRVNAVTNPLHKPRMFQGSVGLAMSVYQSYTFHMLNNLFRYADKGVKAAPAAIVAMNASFFGAGSVPGFQQLNQMIAERSDGNTDLYGAITKAAGGDREGRDLSDFLLYGAGSALLQSNLFVRGDMNPRNATIVPTSVWDFPTIQAVGRVVDSVGAASQRLVHGEAFLPTVADAVVGLGLNRPLRGMWEVAKGRSVDGNAATVQFHEDVWDTATIARAAGLRPLNEAIVRDYQSRTYQIRASQHQAKKALGAHIRRMYDEKGEGVFEQEGQMQDWMRMYQKANGSAANFQGFLQDQLTKGDVELGVRLEKMVGKNSSAIAQYRAIVGEASVP